MIDIGVLRAAVATGATAEQLLAMVEAMSTSPDRIETVEWQRHQRELARQRASRYRAKKREESTIASRDASRYVTLLTPSPEVSPLVNPLPTPTPKTPLPSADPHGGRKRGTRIPSDWKPNEADALFAVREGLNTVAKIDREADRFRDYWSAKSGASATKINWSATWRNWVRNARDRHGVSPQPAAAETIHPANWREMSGDEQAAWIHAQIAREDAENARRRGTVAAQNEPAPQGDAGPEVGRHGVPLHPETRTGAKTKSAPFDLGAFAAKTIDGLANILRQPSGLPADAFPDAAVAFD